MPLNWGVRIAALIVDRNIIRPESDLTPLAGLADLVENCDIFPYNEIPNFPMTTVPGHVSRLLFGTLQGVTVMLMQGRFHAYEGHPLGLVSMHWGLGPAF